eukprot:6406609-Amphidinium_carterae.1
MKVTRHTKLNKLEQVTTKPKRIKWGVYGLVNLGGWEFTSCPRSPSQWESLTSHMVLPNRYNKFPAEYHISCAPQDGTVLAVPSSYRTFLVESYCMNDE